MKWKKISIETIVAAEDIISAELDAIGIEGVEIEDKVPLSDEDKKRMFIDILPELLADDGVALLTFYLEENADFNAKIEEVKEVLKEISTYMEIGSGELTIGETEDKDWINNWKEFFKPFRVDDEIIIKPTWETLDEVKPGEMVVEIDPGTAFGTGSHETTRLCILNIKKYIKAGNTVLDVGTGSGILSIISKKLGSDHTVGIDIDGNAVKIAEENTEINGMKTDSDVTSPAYYKNAWEKKAERIDFLTGNLIDDAALREKVGKYDLVVANILADIIIPLSGVIRECMKPGALFISSGIIKEKEAAVTAALSKNGFEIVEITRMGDWVSVVAK